MLCNIYYRRGKKKKNWNTAYGTVFLHDQE